MTYDVAIIGAGAAGEAASLLAGERKAKAAIIEKDLVGGECGFWACMPTKSLLDSAHRRALGAGYSWKAASDRRDWMISREEIDYPSDAAHLPAIEAAGTDLIRGTARITAPGKVEVKGNGKPVLLEARSIVVATGSLPVAPPIEGLAGTGYWTTRDATSLRDLPSSLIVLGAGAAGVELAQVFARFEVAVTIVEAQDRLLPLDHPRSSDALADQLRAEGIDVRLGVMAQKVSAGGKGRQVHLSDGSVVEASELLVSVGRRPADLGQLGVEEAGAKLNERGGVDPDEHMKIADGLFVAGDVAGGAQFTHVADYEGRVATANALGDSKIADLNSVPKTTFTDPSTASVGITVEDARASGVDAFELTQDFATTSRGYTIEGSTGHVTVVIDRERKLLAGAFIASPMAGEYIHAALLAIKSKISIEVLADAVYAYPTGARIFGNLMLEAHKKLS